MHATAFLAAIRADPDSAAPRLAFAAWLDQRGDPRGEFIRVQCRLAELPAQHPDYLPLKEREEALLATRQPQLLGALAGLPLDVRCERGLPISVTCTAATFLQHADLLFREAPLHEVCLKQLTGLVEALAACPALAQVERLWLTFNHLTAADGQALAASPHLEHLTTLNLGHNDLGDAGLTALATSAHLPGLQHLWAANNGIGDAAAQALAASPLLARLRTLRLNGNRLTDAGVTALAEAASAGTLTGLNLSGNAFGDRGAQALATSPHLAGLHWLLVKKGAFGEEAAEQLRRRFRERLNAAGFA